MIVQIRGTSGSGKTHLMNTIFKLYDSRVIFKIPGRRRPIGYLFQRAEGNNLAVPGHYETPCGGCDTIKTPKEVFERVKIAHNPGIDVLFEGLLVSEDSKRTLELHADGYPLAVVLLTTPLDVCLKSIMDRRIARCKPGQEPKPLNPKNTSNRIRVIDRAVGKLERAGVIVFRCGRDQAQATVEEILQL